MEPTTKKLKIHETITQSALVVINFEVNHNEFNQYAKTKIEPQVDAFVYQARHRNAASSITDLGYPCLSADNKKEVYLQPSITVERNVASLICSDILNSICRKLNVDVIHVLTISEINVNKNRDGIDK